MPSFEWLWLLLLFFDGRLLVDVKVGAMHEMSGRRDAAGSSASRSSSLRLSLSAEPRCDMLFGRLLTRFRNVDADGSRLLRRCWVVDRGLCEARRLRGFTSPFVSLVLREMANRLRY